MKAHMTDRSIGVKEPLPGVVYPPATRLAEYVAAGALTHETLADGFRRSFRRHADRVALCGSGEPVSYRQLDETTDRLAAGLLRVGLKPTDRVVFQLGNSYELVYSLIACLKAGIIPVCTLAAHREHEISYLAAHSGAKAHLVAGDDPKFDDIEFALKMRASAPSMQVLLQARGTARGGAATLASIIASVSLEQAQRELGLLDLDPFQVAVFQLSGGTTGVPKIIPRFHNEYLYNMRAVAQFRGFEADDVLFMPLPMMHNLNMGCCLGPFLLTGGAVTVARDMSMGGLVDLFNELKPTWAVLGGPILEKLRPAIEGHDISFSSLRSVICSSGAPRIRRVTGAPVWHIFGMTEGVIMFTKEGDPQEVIDEMVGRPVSPFDEVKLFVPGTEQEITTPDTEGECAFAGPYTIHGYYDAPERDAETFTSGGMYRSGDLMSFRDIDGKRYYKFCGRTKDVVDRGGEKINCGEVEDVLASYPGVAAVAVVAMPDPVYRERACAFVIAKGGGPVPTTAGLGDYLRQRGVAKFKWPERVEIVSEFPLTGSGKLSKPTLKKMIADKLAQEKSEAAKAVSNAKDVS